MSKRIHGAGGGGGGGRRGGGGNQVVYLQAPAPVYTPPPAPRSPTYTADDPGLKSTSFAQIQMLICEGEVEGPLHGNTKEGLEKSVLLDDTPVRVGTDVSPQPSDLVFSWGRPVGQQSGVPGYNRISDVITVDKEVRFNLPVAQTVTGSDPTGTYYGQVLLTFQGLVSQNSYGDVLNAQVDYRIEYVDSLNVIRVIADENLNSKFSGQFQIAHDWKYEGPGPWTVRVYRNTEDDQDRSNGAVNYQTTFNFASVGVSLDQKLVYPHSSVLTVGIRADQYSAIPQIGIDMKGLKIEVPSNYDPEKRTYTGTWDGTFKTAYSNNPAWILRDIILSNRYGLGEYVTSDHVDKWTLYTIAQYCDEQVPADLNGNLEPRFTCNLILQTSEEAWNVLQQLSSIFRGLLYYAGGYIVSLQDVPKKPVFTFTEANTLEQVENGRISKGNFTYAGAAKRARHTVILASWDDPNDNYQPRVEYVADEEGIARFGYKSLDLRLLGVTSRGQALRAAQWSLLSEKLLDDTVTFRSNEIGAAVRPGDVVKIADPTKAARRYGGRLVMASNTSFRLDDAPTAPPAGWAGATISYMAVDADGQPEVIERSITAVNGSLVSVAADATKPTPKAGAPWVIDAPDRTTQLFRIVTVEEQDDGIYAFTGLRYREDIYSAVDNDTPLLDDEDYLFKLVAPDPPTLDRVRVVYNNGQAKLDVSWIPASTNNQLNGFDLSVRGYRLQWQAGDAGPVTISGLLYPTPTDDPFYEAPLTSAFYDTTTSIGTNITWENVWREVPLQTDNREQIRLDEYVAADRFRVRIAAVGRLGAQSEWSPIRLADPVEVAFPMPDISQVGIGQLGHLNQSSGGQLFNLLVTGQVPDYVTGYRLSARPSRLLTDVEQAGLDSPDLNGWYNISDVTLGDYYSLAFHALVDWEVRANFTTAIRGLSGPNYATDMVYSSELYPPVPEQFVVVTEPLKQSQALTRRFSWDYVTPAPHLNRWPTGVVSDIVAFDVRFKAGTVADWERSLPLYADGIAGDQRWFETTLFDSGSWVVMIKARDRTGWQSPTYAYVVVNLGDALLANAVQRRDLKPTNFPGKTENAERIFNVSGLLYEDPTSDPFYRDPQIDEFYEGASGNVLKQIDPALRSVYYWPFAVSENGVGVVVHTYASATYQWFLRKVPKTGTDLIYPDPTSAVMYEAPLLDPFYGVISSSLSQEFHPLAPFEKVDAGHYELAVLFISTDGTTPGEIWDVDVILDYPDIVETFEDELIPVGGRRLTFTQSFRRLKSVNLTLQDSPAPGVAAIAMVSGKNASGFTVRCYDTDGNDVEGLVDAQCVGY